MEISRFDRAISREPKGTEADILSRDLDMKANRFWEFEVEGVFLGSVFLYAGSNIGQAI